MVNEKWEERRSGRSKNRAKDLRGPFERDRARIVHSSSFRRLQAKTQVLGIGESDFYRTRLTHSLEVAQIGSGLVRQIYKKNKDSKSMKPWLHYIKDIDLITTICLAHDLGHPPFGHGGEIALNYKMRKYGGFEGNAQTLRILSKLDKYTQKHGMDLTRRSMLGILKYPGRYSNLLSKSHKSGDHSTNIQNHHKVVASEWTPPKCYYDEEIDIVDWILKPLTVNDKNRFMEILYKSDESKNNGTRYKSLDTSIMDLADDIAYGVHDLEDAISLKLIDKQDWLDIVAPQLKNSQSRFNGEKLDTLSSDLFSDEYYIRKKAIGGLVNWFIVSAKIYSDGKFENPLLKYNLKLPKKDREALSSLKDFIKEQVIYSHPVQLLEYKGQQIIMELFDALLSDPKRLLPKTDIIKWEAYKIRSKDETGARIVCDYIANMTDDYATRIYKCLFVAGDGSIFHKL